MASTVATVVAACNARPPDGALAGIPQAAMINVNAMSANRISLRELMRLLHRSLPVSPLLYLPYTAEETGVPAFLEPKVDRRCSNQ